MESLTPNQPLVTIKNLTKYYPTFTLDSISFDIPKGSIVGLIGENGAGKSTTINAMLDLIPSDRGEVTFWGQNIADHPELKEDIGVVFDQNHFYETLTPEKIEKICRSAYKKWDTELYNQYLSRFELPKNHEIKQFSNGMKVKLNIAVALSHHPRLLILDEATNGLDPVVRDDMLDLFLDFVQNEEHAILMSSHITSDLEKIADYITFIHHGKCQFSKEKDDLKYNYGLVKCGEDLFQTLSQESILAYRKMDYHYEVLVNDKNAFRELYPEAVIDPASIDDILLTYIKGGRK